MRSLRGIAMVLAMSARLSPWQAGLCVLEALGNVIHLLQPLYLAWFTAAALQHDNTRMVLSAAAFTASVGLTWLLQTAGTVARVDLMDRVGFAFDTEISRITATIPTVDHLESPRYLDQVDVLRQEEDALGGAFNSILIDINQQLTVIGTLLLALAADPRLLLLAVASLPTLACTRWLARWHADAETASAQPGRLARHLLEVGTTLPGAAEARVFGIGSTLRTDLAAAVTRWRGPRVRVARRTSLLQAACSTVFFLTAAAVLAWMIHDALHGQVTLSTLVLAVLLVGRLQNAGQTIQWTVISIGRIIRTVGRFTWLRDYQAATDRAHTGTAAPPDRLATGIRLENLTFHYPDSDRDVLHDVNVDLRAGTVVALVGENGAGKSTLVKLLTGLHRPTSGRILVDGTDLAALDLTAWRAQLSGAFQDYARLELTALESVGVGDLSHVDDETRVWQALRDGAAEDVLTALPHGLHTQLGTGWPGGVDVSVGQWQRLAIGRGMMRTIDAAPLLLVLDEPTAALDADTEHALFERYIAAAKQTRRQGGLTLLVTHRFSTVSAADLVLVLQDGRITETGTHAELIAANGRYAQLYGLQARGYS